MGGQESDWVGMWEGSCTNGLQLVECMHLMSRLGYVSLNATFRICGHGLW